MVRMRMGPFHVRESQNCNLQGPILLSYFETDVCRPLTPLPYLTQRVVWRPAEAGRGGGVAF